MTASMVKTEEKRLNKFVWAVDDQPENRENPATETKNTVQFRRLALKQPHNLHRWLDLSTKQPPHAGGGIPLGECRLSELKYSR